MPTRGLGRARRLFLAVAATSLLGLLPGPATEAAVPVDGCGEPVFRPDGRLWSCTFADDFDAATLDPSKWVAIRTVASGYRNAQECYLNTPDTVRVAAGKLRLSVLRMEERFACDDPLRGTFYTRYQAGYVSTWGRFSQTYGRFEFRVKFPSVKAPGLQSALWLWPVDATRYGERPASGEIDVAEWFSSHLNQIVPNVHYVGEDVDIASTSDSCFVRRADRFHTYTLEWGPRKIRISYDGKTCLVNRWRPYWATTSAPFDHPFHLNLTQALGIGDNAVRPRTPLPATMVVDYVRAWR